MILIDAQNLIKDIMKRKDINMGVKSLVCEVINYQPTAYDVDKVVEQLENLKIEKEIGSHKVMIREAIEIVKAGGIDGKSQ